MTAEQISPRLLSWAVNPEQNTLEQAARTSRLPFIHGHVALMPDAHWGMGSTIGSVIPTMGAIIPAAVGVDIGCGMLAARVAHSDGSSFVSWHLPDDMTRLHELIASRVPAGVGVGHITNQHILSHTPTVAWDKRATDLENTAQRQLGTLGSGNHFVEICLDEMERVWIVLHSGSRGVGNKLAQTHIGIAKGLMKDWFINLEDPDLAYLVQGTVQFNEYLADMLWAQSYAMCNREIMLSAVLGALCETTESGLTVVDQINCHHNFTQMERHMGKNVWLTRKGAIKADIGDRGVIPGSMGTNSYVVSGLGNTASYKSCAHGAGRRLGRRRAEQELTFESLEAAMEGKTWNHNKALLDEHPFAYKNIDEVMSAQKDLVTVEHILCQVLNYKGV